VEGTATYAPVVTVTRASQLPALSSATPRCAPDNSTAPVQYDISTIVDVDSRNISVIMRTLYRNETGQPLQQIVFNVDPNRKSGAFNLLSLNTSDLEKYVLTGPRLEALLKSPLDIHCQIAIDMSFTVQLNAIPPGYLSRGYFGFSERQLNLGNWLPEIAPFLNGSWITPKSSAIGEYTVSVLGDFDVRVRVKGGDQAHMDVIGPGDAAYSGGIWQFKAAHLRSFTLCVSWAMSKLTATADDGTVVDLYYFKKGQPDKAPDGSPINGPQYSLDTAQAAINVYTRLFGPNPYKRIVVVEADFADGMEFSGLVFVSHQWFAMYEGKPDSWLTLITAHEISHQWWYALVSDDQGQYPYLDEALALYSEMLYLEARYPSLVAWWWKFRVTQYTPQGQVDTSVYEYNALRLYINAVYLRGASMLQEVRSAIGDDAFFKWLRAYITTEAGKVATPADLWQAMRPDDYVKTADIRARYLRQPNPLNPAAAVVISPTAPARIRPTATAGG
jgi:hypothetical protein